MESIKNKRSGVFGILSFIFGVLTIFLQLSVIFGMASVVFGVIAITGKSRAKLAVIGMIIAFLSNLFLVIVASQF